jgi:hypothetical protein
MYRECLFQASVKRSCMWAIINGQFQGMIEMPPNIRSNRSIQWLRCRLDPRSARRPHLSATLEL